MRFTQIPSGNSASQQIVTPDFKGRPQQVVIQNVSGVTVWVADSQTALDSSVDQTGTPQYGYILLANSEPLTIDAYVGGFWARSNGGGGAIEANFNPLCNP